MQPQAHLPTQGDVSAVQELFDCPLPTEWVDWVLKFGGLAGFGRELLGLRCREPTRPSARADALDLLLLLRLTEESFGRDLLPIEVLPERQLACVEVATTGGSRVVVVDLDRPDLRVEAASDLGEFVDCWRADLQAMADVVEEAFDEEDAGRTEMLQRPDEWSTRRLCSQNVIVALLQTRHNRESNEHDVAVFATATLTSFAHAAPVRWALTTVLTEAYSSGGTLAVNFVRRSRNEDDGHFHYAKVERDRRQVPFPIVAWAQDHDIQLDPKQGGWDAGTGELLFLAAANLPHSLRQLLDQAPVSRAMVCAAVSSGTWPALDVEVVLRWAPDPTRVLTGSVGQMDRLRYVADQHVVRSAMVLSSLRRYFERAGQSSASDEDDTARSVHVAIDPVRHREDPTLSAVRFSSTDGQPLALDWHALAGSVPPAREIVTHVFTVEADVLEELGPALIASLSPGEVLLVPADAAARVHTLDTFIDAAAAADVSVVAAPDYTTTLDVAISARLDRSRLSRQ